MMTGLAASTMGDRAPVFGSLTPANGNVRIGLSLGADDHRSQKKSWEKLWVYVWKQVWDSAQTASSGDG